MFKAKRIIIGFEMSGIVANAFASKGHLVTSCDLKPNLSFKNHIQGDIWDVLSQGQFDMGIFFPPCIYLAKCQMAQCFNDKGRMREALKAIQVVDRLLSLDIPEIAIENPPGILNSYFRPPDQIVRPYNFGNKHSKEICLWLKNLPPLIYGAQSPGRIPVANHVNSRMSQEKKSEIKSIFFPEVAEAMALQWG